MHSKRRYVPAADRRILLSKSATLANMPSILGIISGSARSYLRPQYTPTVQPTARGSHRGATGRTSRDATIKLAFNDPTGHTFAAPNPLARRMNLRGGRYPSFAPLLANFPSVDIYRQTGFQMIDQAVRFARNIAAIPRRVANGVLNR